MASSLFSQHPIVIQTTYNYVSVAGLKKTVLVLENDEEKLNKLIEAAERPFREKQKAAEAKRQAEKEHKAAVEAAKWRTWTDSSGKHKIKAKFSGVISGIVKLVKEDGSAVRIPLKSYPTKIGSGLLTLRSDHPSPCVHGFQSPVGRGKQE